MKSISIAMILLALGVTPVLAQVAGRETGEERRIIQGERSGELTRGEAARLQGQQQRIDERAAIDRARNGGRLTASERANLDARQNRASASIYREKHNDAVH